MAQKSEKKKLPDINSIRTTTLVSFVIFALFLLVIVWGLGSFFMKMYYERARTQEVMQVADGLESEYKRSQDEFDDYAVRTAESNDIYIRLDALGKQFEYDGTGSVRDTGLYSKDIDIIAEKLSASGQSSVTEVRMDANSGSGNSRLVYASIISSDTEQSLLYIIAPLVPDPVTVRILTNMLIYIAAIVLLMSILLAYALSRRLSSPIAALTARRKCPAVSSSGWPSPGPSPPIRPSSWPTSPPARWIPARAGRCCPFCSS